MFDVPAFRVRLMDRLNADRKGANQLLTLHDVNIIMEVFEDWVLESFVTELNSDH